MPIGVGSVGDIISICLLAKDLVEALNSSRGASAEYQEIVRELWGLERALLQVDLLYRTHNDSPELNALHETARRAVDNCQVCIAGFLDKIKKYQPSLRENGSGSVFRDTSRKIQWQVMQSSDVPKFRAEIGAHSQSVSMLLATLSVNVMTINDRKLNARLTDSETKSDSKSQEHTTIVTEVRDRLKENNTLISAVATKVSDALRFEWFQQLGSELKSMMNRIFSTNVATYEAVVAIQRVLPSQLERSMFREPFILEDAIGRISTVHMDFITSWEAFDAVMRLRFQEFQGFKKVQENEYVLQEHSTGREIKRTRGWEVAFMPGQRVNMSLVFVGKAKNPEEILSTSCPNCQSTSTKPQDSDVQCKECGMWYRRITEFPDVDLPDPVRVQVFERPSKVHLGQNAFSGITFGPKAPSKYPPVSVKRKLDKIELEEDDIAHFKRVRPITSNERVRFIPGPFRGFLNAASDLLLAVADRQQAEESVAWNSFRAKQTSHGPAHGNTIASLGNLARTLHNVRTSSDAEDLLLERLKDQEATLIENDPSSLRRPMSSLMMVLIEQKNLSDAEALRVRDTEFFPSSKTSIEGQEALFHAFELSYPFHQVTFSRTVDGQADIHNLPTLKRMVSTAVRSGSSFFDIEKEEISKTFSSHKPSTRPPTSTSTELPDPHIWYCIFCECGVIDNDGASSWQCKKCLVIHECEMDAVAHFTNRGLPCSHGVQGHLHLEYSVKIAAHPSQRLGRCKGCRKILYCRED